MADWRRFFGDPALPFYYVQLAAWLAPTDDPAGGDGWALFRDAQRRLLEQPGTGMASAIDIGDAGDIHPRNKFDVGERLALLALAGTYGREVESCGPLFRRLLGDGANLGVKFSYAEQPSPDGLAQAFHIAGDTGFLKDEPAALVLGDNLFYGHDLVKSLERASARAQGATIFGYHVADARS